MTSRPAPIFGLTIVAIVWLGLAYLLNVERSNTLEAAVQRGGGLVRLFEDSAGSGRVDQGEIGPPELAQGLERHHRQRVAQERPQASGASHELARLAHVATAGSRVPGRSEDERAGPVRVEVASVDDLDGPLEH